MAVQWRWRRRRRRRRRRRDGIAAASWGDGIAAALLVYGEIYGQGLTHWTGRNPGHSAIVVCSVSCRAVALNDVLHFVHCRQNGSTLLPTFLLATSARP